MINENMKKCTKSCHSQTRHRIVRIKHKVILLIVFMLYALQTIAVELLVEIELFSWAKSAFWQSTELITSTYLRVVIATLYLTIFVTPNYHYFDHHLLDSTQFNTTTLCSSFSSPQLYRVSPLHQTQTTTITTYFTQTTATLYWTKKRIHLAQQRTQKQCSFFEKNKTWLVSHPPTQLTTTTTLGGFIIKLWIPPTSSFSVQPQALVRK